MTAENVLQDVLLAVGIDDASAQLSSGNYDIRQILAFMNEAGRDISRRAEWSQMFSDWTITGGVDEVSLPSDFHEMAEGGAVRINKSGYHPIRVVVDPVQWQFLSATSSAQPYCHISDQKLLFSPTLDDDGAKVRYVSTNWVSGAAEITQNSDVLLIPERLVAKGAIWRWRRQKGMPFDDQMAEFEADLTADLKADRGQA